MHHIIRQMHLFEACIQNLVTNDFLELRQSKPRKHCLQEETSWYILGPFWQTLVTWEI